MDSDGIGSLVSSLVDQYSRLTKETRGILGLVIATILFLTAYLRFKKGGKKNANNNIDGDKSWPEAATKAKAPKIKNEDASEGSPIQPNVKNDGKLRNVFSVKQKPIATGNATSDKKSSSEKPFESSYYFAHNKHSTGGGYKDGLRAEDYVMNGPRLLSKGGVRVNDKKPNNDTAENDNEDCIQSEQTEAKERSKPKLTASTPITKYMWDDDGSGNVAKIHIDTLPIASTKTIKWEEAGISKEQVQVRLIGESNEGLFVNVITREEKRYHLHVPKMYGEADSVKCIVKKHKLLIKITKKVRKHYSKRHSTEEGVWTAASKALGKLTGGGEEEEYISVSWPRLSASSVGGLGGGTADIDEKLFKNMDFDKNGGDDFGM